ncbi:MAG TPA: CpsD/CapB family tyrosine-protein kinase [Dongiaceae bacterium]|nr:CpsD/CapB family tyrosine-protein kinase [Dongiaceae bacterium]
MSKYFNQTSRPGTASSVKDAPEAISASVISEVAEPEVAVAAPVAPAPKIEDSPRLELPFARLISMNFLDGDRLQVAQESYRALRTRLLRRKSAEGLQSFVVTSASQGEGKTMTSANLALCCAQLHDMRVLLIDGDTRSHGLTRLLGLHGKSGLANVLEGSAAPREGLFRTESDNLYVMGAGSSPLPPAELHASPKWNELMKFSRESFDLLIVDSPPVLNLADVELISSFCDGIVFIVRACRTTREVLRKSAAQLDQKKIVGVVFNAAEGGRSAGDYTYKYGNGD